MLLLNGLQYYKYVMRVKVNFIVNKINLNDYKKNQLCAG